MQLESAALLWDARRAAELIGSFITGRTWSDYLDDPMLRSAVERQFEIIGESLNRVGHVDSETAATLPSAHYDSQATPTSPKLSATSPATSPAPSPSSDYDTATTAQPRPLGWYSTPPLA